MKKILSVVIALPLVFVSFAGCTSDLSSNEAKETTSTTEITSDSSDFNYDNSEENFSEEEKNEEVGKEEKKEKTSKSLEEEKKQKQEKAVSKDEEKQKEVDKQDSTSKKNEESKTETDSATNNKTSTRTTIGTKEQASTTKKTTTTETTSKQTTATKSPSSSKSQSSSSSLSNIEMEVVNLVNKERKARNLQPLQVDPTVANVAAKKSSDMKNNNYFSHQSPTYGSPFQMLKQFGVSYRTAGENIAAGQRTAEQVMKSWMESSGHRANILNPSFTHIGVGFSQGGAYGTYWTQIFIQK